MNHLNLYNLRVLFATETSKVSKLRKLHSQSLVYLLGVLRLNIVETGGTSLVIRVL